MKRCRAVVIVPCYNESQRLNVAAFRSFAAWHTDVRFLFVNDGSTDSTLRVLEDLCAGEPSFQLLDLPQNAGKAEAVRRGMLAAAGAPLIAYWDADLATPLDAIPAMCEVLERRTDVSIVAGVRLPLLGHRIERRPLRRVLGRGFAWCASKALGLSMVDTQCGAKMFRPCDALDAAIQVPFHSRWIFDVELLVRWGQYSQAAEGVRLRQRLYEFPLERWNEVGGSHLRSRDFARAIGELAAIYFRRRTSPAPPKPAPAIPLRRAA